jgi:divalent metal cation (Fe/Co/Zn/Cd) transporter
MEEHLRHSLSNHPHVFQNLHHSSSNRSDRMTPVNEGTTTALEHELTTMQQHRNGSSSDEEGAPPPRYTSENDPFRLASKLKTEDEIRQMKANTSRKRDSTKNTKGHKVAAIVQDTARLGKQAFITKKLQGFYESQNENIERMLKPVEEHRRAARELNVDNRLKYRIAVYGSFAANIILAVIQVYGAVSSGSLSLFTTMADAIFDPMSNLTLLLCNKAVNRVDPRKFPAGKARLETAGNICFCFLMTAVSFILIAFSVRELAVGSEEETQSFHLPSVIAVAVAFATKLALFLYCWALRNQVSQIRILWEDHRNDLFINGFGILTSVGGSKLRWWIDPMGAIILSVLVSGLWLHSAYGEFQLLVGVTADTKMQQLITYICMSPFHYLLSLILKAVY